MSRTLDRTQAKFDKMPQVGADPVVESGSNADGEWTRFADGSYIARIFGLSVTITAGSTIFDVYWTLPITAVGDSSHTTNVASVADGTTWRRVGIIATRGTVSPLRTQIWCVEGASFAADTIASNFIAIGRWK